MPPLAPRFFAIVGDQGVHRQRRHVVPPRIAGHLVRRPAHRLRQADRERVGRAQPPVIAQPDDHQLVLIDERVLGGEHGIRSRRRRGTHAAKASRLRRRPSIRPGVKRGLARDHHVGAGLHRLPQHGHRRHRGGDDAGDDGRGIAGLQAVDGVRLPRHADLRGDAVDQLLGRQRSGCRLAERERRGRRRGRQGRELTSRELCHRVPGIHYDAWRISDTGSEPPHSPGRRTRDEPS